MIPGFQVLVMLSFRLRRQDEPIKVDVGRLPSAGTEQLEWDRPWAFLLEKREPGGGSQETPVQAATLCMGSPWSASERSVIAAGSLYILGHQYAPFIFRYHTRTILWNTVKAYQLHGLFRTFQVTWLG
jgi:hypothetical protein